MENTTIDYVDYVQEQIRKFESLTEIHSDSDITPEIINSALATYENVNIALIGEYQRAKINEYETNKGFSQWYDGVFSIVRREMIDETSSKTIKIALKEYESEIRVRHSKDYWEWQDRITVAENKTSFILRLVEAWKKYDNILITLSSNMKQEMYALSIGNRINSDDKIRALPKRKRLEE